MSLVTLRTLTSICVFIYLQFYEAWLCIVILLPLSSSFTKFIDFSLAGLKITHPGTSMIGLPICRVTGGFCGNDCTGEKK